MTRPLLALALLALGAGAAPAQEDVVGRARGRVGEPAAVALAGAELERTTEELASLMRCPVCQGLSIADSPTPLAIAMKNEVRELLAAGYGREQVLEYFEASYGEFVRLAPKARGFNLAVWVAPALALLAGLWLIVRRARRGAPAAAAANRADPELEAYRRRVRREVGS